MITGYEVQQARLNEALDRIPADVKAEIVAAHRELGWGCGAMAEDTVCCLNHLLGEQ